MRVKAGIYTIEKCSDVIEYHPQYALVVESLREKMKTHYAIK